MRHLALEEPRGFLDAVGEEWWSAEGAYLEVKQRGEILSSRGKKYW